MIDLAEASRILLPDQGEGVVDLVHRLAMTGDGARLGLVHDISLGVADCLRLHPGRMTFSTNSTRRRPASPTRTVLGGAAT